MLEADIETGVTEEEVTGQVQQPLVSQPSPDNRIDRALLEVGTGARVTGQEEVPEQIPQPQQNVLGIGHSHVEALLERRDTAVKEEGINYIA